MSKSGIDRTFGALAVAWLTVFAAGGAFAGDEGVVRIADRDAPSVVRITDRTVRGQSPVDMTLPAVQQTSLFQCCPEPTCPDCCDVGSCHISGGYCPCPTYECYECECEPSHGCPLCPCFNACGHECAVVGWLIHVLQGAHEVKADLWAALGLPTHCCCCQKRVKRLRCKRQRCKGYRSYRERLCKEREHRCRERECRRDRLRNWIAHSKLNYFCTTKPPCGHYTIVYPVDPWYGDARDGGVYSAEGYGGPMSVPLAPVIRHTFNYGWGVPSSRLTPVSHLANRPNYGYGPPTGYGPYSPYYASAGPAAKPAAQSAAANGPATY